MLMMGFLFVFWHWFGCCLFVKCDVFSLWWQKASSIDQHAGSASADGGVRQWPLVPDRYASHAPKWKRRQVFCSTRNRFESLWRGAPPFDSCCINLSCARAQKGSRETHKINIFDAKPWFTFVLMSPSLCSPLDTMQIELISIRWWWRLPVLLVDNLTESNWICIRPKNVKWNSHFINHEILYFKEIENTFSCLATGYRRVECLGQSFA